MSADQNSRSTFRDSLPLTLTSFVNRAGGVGMSVLPILLVERHVSSQLASGVLAVVKSAGILGIFLGGTLTDRFPLKPVILGSFLLVGFGLIFTAFANTWLLIALLAFLANVGQSMFPSSSRMLLREMVAKTSQREAIGWLRTANNLGQVVAYSVSWLASWLGVQGLLILDGLTSLAAALIGKKIIPPLSSTPTPLEEHPKTREMSARLKHRMFRIATVSAFMSFLYDCFIVGSSARLELFFPGHGLRWFAEVMLINTVLCALLAVPTARTMNNPNTAFRLGFAGILAGSVLGLGLTPTLTTIYAGTFIFTMGEISFGALNSWVLMAALPDGSRQGTWYGVVMIIQQIARMMAGALAFPLFVQTAGHPFRPFLIFGIEALLVVFGLAVIHKDLKSLS